MAFIASDSTITSLSLKSGMSGYDLDGLTLGGIAFPAAIDAESPSHATALYCTGFVSSVTLGGAGAGDFVIAGTNPVSLLSNKTFTISKGGLQGDLATGGAAGAMTIGGTFASTMNINGGVASLTITGGDFAGSLNASGAVGAISVTSVKTASATTGGNVTSGAAIHVTGADPKSGLSVKAMSATGQISGLDLNLSGGLGPVTAGSWTGGTAQAASAGAITLSGDFGTHLTLDGGLKSLAVKGGDFTGSLTAAGSVGAISVASAKVSSTTVGGNVTDTAAINIAGADASTNVALKSLSATGAITDLGLTLDTGSLGSLIAGGAISGMDMTVSAAGIGAITAGSWTGGTAHAASAGAITLSGDFGTHLTLDGGLKSLTITGGNFTGKLDAAGPVGAVSVSSKKTAGGTTGGDITNAATIDIDGADPKTNVALKSLSATGSITGLGLTLGTGSLGSLIAGGAISGMDITLSAAGIGLITAGSWTGGTAHAASAGAITLSGNFGTQASFSGGVTSLTIKGGDFAGSLTAAGPVGAISAASAKIAGATAGGNVTSSAAIHVTGADPKSGLSVKAMSATGQISGLDLDLTGGLGPVTAGSWTGGTAQAASAGAIILSGDFGAQLALAGPLASLAIKGGDFTGSLTASGAVGPVSVGSVKTAGGTTGGNVTSSAVIHVTGSDTKTGFSVKSLSASGPIAGLNLNLSGGLGSLSAASWTGGSAQANASGAITLSGNFSAPLELTNGLAKMTIKGGDFNGSISAGGEIGAISITSVQTAPGTPLVGGNMNGSASIIVIGENPASHLSLDSLTAAGTLTALNVNLSGALGTLTAGRWNGGTAQAASSGDVTINGDFTGHLVLTGGLASMTVKGGEFAGSIVAGAPVGKITVSSNTVNEMTQGGDLNGATITVNGQDPVTGLSVESLSATGHIATSTLTLSGGLGSLSAGDSLSQDTVHAASLGAVTLTGDFDLDSQFVLTGGLASLSITGGDLDGTISAGGLVGKITVAQLKSLGGAVNSAQITVTGADANTGLSLQSLTAAGDIYSLTLNLSGGLGSLIADNWTGGTAHAASVGDILLSGNYDSQLAMTGGLKSLKINGGDLMGSFSAGGPVGLVSVSSQTVSGKQIGGNITSAAKMTLNGADPKTGLCLSMLSATGDVALDLTTSFGLGSLAMGSVTGAKLTAAYIENVKVYGNIGEAELTLTGHDAMGRSLGTAVIDGWFGYSTLRATADVGSISVGGAISGDVYVGVAPDATGLITSINRFVSHASIGTLTVTGAVKTGIFDSSLIDSNMAAYAFSTISFLGGVEWANGGVPFGTSAHTIANLAYRDASGALVHSKDVSHSISYYDTRILILN